MSNFVDDQVNVNSSVIRITDTGKGARYGHKFH